jgi:hypothetical protein
VEDGTPHQLDREGTMYERLWRRETAKHDA